MHRHASQQHTFPATSVFLRAKKNGHKLDWSWRNKKEEKKSTKTLRHKQQHGDSNHGNQNKSLGNNESNKQAVIRNRIKSLAGGHTCEHKSNTLCKLIERRQNTGTK
jgi:hypothetical protein